jgi:DNA modification methylase
MKIELWPIDRPKPYPGNPRDNDAAVEVVARSLRAYGFRQPVVVDRDEVVIVGHTRLKAARKLGLTQVPVHVAADLTPEQVRAYRLADNASAEHAAWDYDLLPIEISELQAANYDLGLLGFGEAELARLLHGVVNDGLTDPDDVPEPPEEPLTRPGDLWVLGGHRVLCGDATKGADVQRLMEGKKAAMLFSDPPWNVAIGRDSNPKHRQRRGLANDDLPPEQFAAFLDGFVAAARPHVAGDWYVVLGASGWPRLDAALRAQGFHWSATIVWAKDTFVLGRSHYHRRYEPVWFGWHGKGKSSFNGRRDLDDVWDIPRPKRSDEHPTMKPVELVRRAVDASSPAGGVVLDPFGGSGTTLIACEQTGRQARLVEIDPLYCDVIVRRFEAFTGKTAERREAGAAA